MNSEPTARNLAKDTKASDFVEARQDEYAYKCDRCGGTMVESNCKIICRNCGHRFDCSDLNIYFD
jgi:hypothetical protein